MTETPRVDDVTVSSQALGPALYIPVCVYLSYSSHRAYDTRSVTLNCLHVAIIVVSSGAC